MDPKVHRAVSPGARRRLGVVSGSRADYGHLAPLLRALMSSPSFDFELYVTGMHLDETFGNTWKQIEADGVPISARVPLNLCDDTGTGITLATAEGIESFGRLYRDTSLDGLVVFGDRFEMLSAAVAALFARLPIIHIGGGDVTEGAYDDAIRHSLSKMAHLHFVTHEAARGRLTRMGEQPCRVHNVGSLCLDQIAFIERVDRSRLESELNFTFGERSLLVTYHPTTAGNASPALEAEELLAALGSIDSRVSLLFTEPNHDSGSGEISAALRSFVAARPNARLVKSLGSRLYYSVIREVSAVVGNSSSGLYEVPSFGKPTVDIGDRQRGRPAADSVIHCAAERVAITAAIESAFTLNCSGVANLYGDGSATRRILEILDGISDFRELLTKEYYDS